MQSDTDRKGIRSTRRPRLDVDMGPESHELAIVRRSKDARGAEGVNMMPEITNRHSKPTCRIVVARTEFTGKQALLYAPPHSGNHQWRVGVAGTAGGYCSGRRILVAPNVVRQKPRNRRDAALSLRRPDRIAAQEYRLAINAVLRGSVAASKSELTASVARVLGFDRTGNDLDRAISDQIDWMIAEIADIITYWPLTRRAHL